MSVPQLAARLEHRLHGPLVTEESLRAGCDFAGAAGLAAVLCRPEHVAAAAERLQGSGVEVVTALGFHDVASSQRTPEVLAAEARELAELGATEVALLSPPGAVTALGSGLLVEQVSAVQEAIATVEMSVRVLLDSEQMNEADIASTCRSLTNAHVRLVQGGTFRGDRSTLSQIELMRAALPSNVLLKWTHPIRNHETVLLCIALGVDRFNADVAELLTSSKKAAQFGPLTVPMRGIDF